MYVKPYVSATIAHPHSVGEVTGSILGPNPARAKSCTDCCYVRWAKSIECVGGMPFSKIGATHYHAKLVIPDKGCAIKRVGYLQ